MNWKKGLKYFGILLIILTILSIFLINRGFKQMYGGFTQLVDVEQFTPSTKPVAIKNVNLLSPDGTYFMEAQTILIAQGLIKAIDSTLNIPPQTIVIDGSGKFLIPGLIDSHVHIFKSPNDLLLYIANGVTQVRELIGDESRLDLKQQIEDGRIGPKMWVTSPPLGTGDDMGKKFITWTRGGINIDNAEAAEQEVKQLFEKGYDGIKVYSHLNKESYLAVTKTAKELGFPVVGHIPWDVEITDIWKNGQSGIAHLEELMNVLRREFGFVGGKEEEFLKFVEAQSADLVRNLLENDIAVTSTLWLVESFVRQKFELDKVLKEIELVYENPGIVEGVKAGSKGFGWLPETNLYRLEEGLTEDEKAGQKKFWTTYAQATQIIARELSKGGVKLMAGTDANLPPTVPGFSLHDELVSLNQAGMSPTQVLQAATSTPANWLKMDAGKIQEGYLANLVLLEKNPLVDIRNTREINMVFANGKTFDRALLDQLLAAVKEANDSSRKVDISGYE